MPNQIRCVTGRSWSRVAVAAFKHTHLATDVEPEPETVDLVIDAVGADATREPRQAWLAAPGGVIVHVGLLPGNAGIDIRKLTLQEITLGRLLLLHASADFEAVVDALDARPPARFALDWIEERPSRRRRGQAFRELDAGTRRGGEDHYASVANLAVPRTTWAGSPNHRTTKPTNDIGEDDRASRSRSPSVPFKDVAAFIDAQPTSRNAWLVVVIALGGVFVDAYDFASLGIGVVQLRQQFNLTPFAVGSVTAMMAVGAFFGAIFGGWYTDRIGRYRMFLIDLVLLVVAALGAACSINITMLLIFRFLMGVGIGLDFPVALSFISEFVSSRRNGASVNLWQPMWYVAASCTGLIILPFYYLDLGPHLWRISVGFGAVPALIILLLRTRFMDESAIWSAQNYGLDEAARVMRRMYGVAVKVAAGAVTTKAATESRFGVLFSPRFRKATIIASVVCATQSMEYFAVGFNIPSISVSLFGSDLRYAILGAIFFNLFGIVGGLLGVRLTQALGCRRLAMIGYGIVIVSLLILFFSGSGLTPWLAAPLYGAFIFGHAFGPGSQGMTIATISYPTSVRGLGSGWGQGMVRVGSIMGLYFFPLVVAQVGLHTMLILITAIPLIGFLVCVAIRYDPVLDGAVTLADDTRVASAIAGVA